MEQLTNFKQSDCTHSSNHIHEWRRHFPLVNTFVPDQLLMEWFFKYLLAPISEDMTKGGVMAEGKVISCAQYLDLFYTQ